MVNSKGFVGITWSTLPEGFSSMFTINAPDSYKNYFLK